METKLFEIRDRGLGVVQHIPIPVMCTLMNSENKAEKYLLQRPGYYDLLYDGAGESLEILMTILSSNRTECDKTAWNDRTFKTAHKYIADHWFELVTGDVIDVEFILGETHHKKISERCEGSGLMARMGEE